MHPRDLDLKQRLDQLRGSAASVRTDPYDHHLRARLDRLRTPSASSRMAEDRARALRADADRRFTAEQDARDRVLRAQILKEEAALMQVDPVAGRLVQKYRLVAEHLRRGVEAARARRLGSRSLAIH